MNNENNDNKIYVEEMEREEVSQDTSSVSGKRKKKKPRVRKKRKKKYYTLRILILILVCVGVYFLLHSKAFTIEKIELEKNEKFTVEHMEKYADLKTGVNMFEINLKDCEKALEERPYMRDAEVKRKLPDTIMVSVDVRTPVAVVKKNGEYIMIDREGYVLEKRKSLPHYTFLDGITVSEAKIGQVVKVKEEKKYQQYLELIDEMDAADLYFRKMVIKDDIVKLYARYSLYCKGKNKNIVEGMRDGNMKAVLYTLSKKGVKKGVVSVEDDKYYSFSKK